ncbi:MAG: hypothetical protein HYT87_03020 [Nitrospirae bacterium]|nr:hypothetical protein [Nitrospirota bacterium]
MRSDRPSAISFQLRRALGALILLPAAFVATAWAEDIPPENQCVKCHLEQEEENEDLAIPPKEWRESIHHENSIACNDCHGGNPAASEEEDAHDEEESEFIGAPADDDVPAVCGKCHVAIQENYVKSKHWLTKKEKRPVCITCHEAHRIKKANLDLINEDTCSECHKYERSKRIKVAMTDAEARLVELENRIAVLRSEGWDVRSLQQAHFAQRNVFHHLSHILDLDRVIEIAETVTKDARILATRIGEQEDVLKRRQIAGGFFTVFLLIGAFVIHRKRKYLEDPKD